MTENYNRIAESSGLDVPVQARSVQQVKRAGEHLSDVITRGKMSAQQIRHKYTSPPAPNAGSTDVNQIAERNGLLLQPHPIKAKFKRQKSNKYCHFHHDQSHVTNDYFHLKASIEKLIHKCHLSECIDKHGSLRHANLSARENDNHKI